MARCVHYNKGYYAVYSTVIDDYVTYKLSHGQMIMFLILTTRTSKPFAIERLLRTKENSCSILCAGLRCENINMDNIYIWSVWISLLNLIKSLYKKALKVAK